ncbi:hypothetical protein KsCSTR_12310 [Candidatus Kuenenia stuttgartiensis]|uniref:Uncharacterized protein n=1 Tax=Kuenenia stuttgartiensis TaxID=174633 RepID=Q1PY75_KUEST|nr:hypothetical protein KsCSTR_12310 [Candidatus Kuenenia stuttgartiensis]CAJ72041.1 unknown protein [Candidatus Kuenenia stuttgartiensis]
MRSYLNRQMLRPYFFKKLNCYTKCEFYKNGTGKTRLPMPPGHINIKRGAFPIFG